MQSFEREINQLIDICLPPITTILRIVTQRKTPDAEERKERSFVQMNGFHFEMNSYNHVHQIRQKAPEE